MNALVFGGSGFLGSHLVDELVKNNIDVYVADIEEGSYLNSKASFITCNILDPKDVAAVFAFAREKNISKVYHLAGFSDLNKSIHEPLKTFNLNVIGTINILEAVSNLPCCHFVYASSAYANSNKGSFYGISKYTSEKIVIEYSKKYKDFFTFNIIQYGSLYGPRADDRNGLFRILNQALSHKKIIFDGTGTESREYIHVVDASRMTYEISHDSLNNNQHILLTGVDRFKLSDLLLMIKEIFNDQIEIEITGRIVSNHYTSTPCSIEQSTPRKFVPKYFTDLGQGLVQTIDYMKRNISENSSSVPQD
jgi:UDP-glucose 4-epimerase